MKFDSYQRFIRSDLYKMCLNAETNKQPLPHAGDHLDDGLNTGISCASYSKLKKSLSNAEDRRRKSLLPWHRKIRCKSRDRADDFQTQKNGSDFIGPGLISNVKDTIGSRSSLSRFKNCSENVFKLILIFHSFDAAISCTARFKTDANENASLLCRIILNNGATTIVPTSDTVMTRQLLERLLEKRGFFFQNFEAFFSGSSQPIDLDAPSTIIAAKEVCIQQRVIFKIDLPNRKVISVKSKPCKTLGEVVYPILQKYNYQMDLIEVCISMFNIR